MSVFPPTTIRLLHLSPYPNVPAHLRRIEARDGEGESGFDAGVGGDGRVRSFG
jgi:hypothetical protein